MLLTTEKIETEKKQSYMYLLGRFCDDRKERDTHRSTYLVFSYKLLTSSAVKVAL